MILMFNNRTRTLALRILWTYPLLKVLNVATESRSTIQVYAEPSCCTMLSKEK